MTSKIHQFAAFLTKSQHNWCHEQEIAVIKNLLGILVAGAALTGAASAADLPRRAAPPPVFTPVPVFTWTGAYF
ncbi:hypothetical protein ACLBX9_01805, partial [Methylobacterium sp. A49B]